MLSGFPKWSEPIPMLSCTLYIPVKNAAGEEGCISLMTCRRVCFSHSRLEVEAPLKCAETYCGIEAN